MKKLISKKILINKKTLKSVGMLSISNIIFQGVLFFVSLILAWILSKEEYGYIRYILQIGNFIVMFIAAGFSSALTRFVAAQRSEVDKYFTAVIVIMLLSFLILVPIFLVFHIDILIYMVVIGYSISLIYYGVIRGFIDYKKIALFNILRGGIILALISLILVITVLKIPIYIIGSYAFSGWIAIFLIEIFIRTNIHFNLKRIKKKIIFQLARFSTFSVLSNVFSSSLITVGYWLLECDYGYAAVAEYSMALTLATLYTFLPKSVNTLLMPKVADGGFSINSYRLKEAIILNILYVILVYTIIIIFGKLGLEILFGLKYINSYYILLILSIGYIFRVIETAFGAFWGGVNKPEYAATSVGIAAGVNLILAIYLINTIGKIGVPWAYVAAFGSTVVTNIMLYRKYKKIISA